jgi:hypothetical protein
MPDPAGCEHLARGGGAVAVDHGRRHLTVAEEFVDGPDVVTAFQAMGGEGMAEGVTTGARYCRVTARCTFVSWSCDADRRSHRSSTAALETQETHRLWRNCTVSVAA